MLNRWPGFKSWSRQKLFWLIGWAMCLASYLIAPIWSSYSLACKETVPPITTVPWLWLWLCFASMKQPWLSEAKPRLLHQCKSKPKPKPHVPLYEEWALTATNPFIRNYQATFHANQQIIKKYVAKLSFSN